MLRRLLIPASVLSLLLFIATIAMWIRGRWREDTFRWTDGQNIYGVTLARGRIAFVSLRLANHSSDQLLGDEPGFRHESDAPGDYYPRWGFGGPSESVHFAGFGYDAGAQLIWWGRCLTLPLWLFALLAVLLAARTFFLWRSTRRLPAHACVVCRYDLRASPDRCPECGTPVQNSEVTNL